MGGNRIVKDYIYDLETYRNCFTAVFAEPTQRKMWVFEISDRKDDSVRFRKFLTERYKTKDRLVGYNNIGFDSPILHHWLANKGMTSDDIYQYAMRIINAFNSEDKFKFRVPKNRQWLRQVDLYMIHHFDNKAKATSLKMLEFNMRSPNISDLPFPVGTELTFEQMDVLIKYNKHDVLETLKFYVESEKAIAFRQKLSKQYGKDFTNHNDTKIGKDYFVMQLEKVDPEACYRQVNGRRAIKQTHRKVIDFKHIIFDYIKFERPEFRALLAWIKKQKIKETKGVFSDIEEHLLGDLAKYSSMIVKKKKVNVVNTVDKETAKQLRKQMKDESLSEEQVEELRDEVCGYPDEKMVVELQKEHPCGWLEREVLKSGKTSWNFKWRIAETLNVVVDGFQLDYGTGGIHGSVTETTFVSDKDWVILDFDYASMYPNIFIKNRIYPEHLGEGFCDIYEDVYKQRKSYKKGTPENAVMKLALNGTYGATNDKFSPFYDPKATMAITVNGQLTLSVLVEHLLKVDGLRIVQANTDGVTVYVKREYEEMVDKIVSDWDKVCGLEMDKIEYDLMAINTVNNYLAVYNYDKSWKLNGCYEYRRDQLGWHQNHSALIIKEAAVRCIIEGVPVERTIKQCKNPYDFMLRTKVPRLSRLVLRKNGEEYLEQNITRYYVSNDGGKLVKIMPPLVEGGNEREIGIDASWEVTPCNDMSNFNWEINYDYYISEAQKLVDGVGDRLVGEK